MDYRDERDALRGRVENLEQDLASARGELARRGEGTGPQRIAELERRSAEARKLLDEINAELAALRPESEIEVLPPVPLQRSPVNGRVAAFVATGLLFSGVIVRLLDDLAPRPVPVPVLRVLPPPPVITPPVVTAEVEPPPAPVSTMAHWSARITRATGRELDAGTPCRIEAALTGVEGTIHVGRVSVECRGVRIYDSTSEREGISITSTGAEERAGARPGVSTYVMQFQDTGTRAAPRSQVSIDTLAGSAAVWSENAPAFHLDLAVPRESDPIEGESLMASVAAVLRRSATVTSVSGASPVHVGATCDLRVAPVARGKCIAHLACGSAVLYGTPTSGMSDCVTAKGAIVTFSDEQPTWNGGDPMLEVDSAAGTMVLADDIGDKRWSVTFGLRR